MKRRSSPAQFDLFPASKRGRTEQPPFPDAEESIPAAEEGPYVPTDAEEQERAEMEHGPGARYVPSKSRSAREAEKRRIRQILDDALGRMGTPGRQLLTDAESPFVAGAREAAERRRRAEEERRKRNGNA